MRERARVHVHDNKFLISACVHVNIEMITIVNKKHEKTSPNSSANAIHRSISRGCFQQQNIYYFVDLPLKIIQIESKQQQMPTHESVTSSSVFAKKKKTTNQQS